MNLVKNLLKIVKNVPQKAQIHSTAALTANSFNYGSRKWEAYNKTIFPPEGVTRPAVSQIGQIASGQYC